MRLTVSMTQQPYFMRYLFEEEHVWGPSLYLHHSKAFLAAMYVKDDQPGRLTG